MKIPKSEAFQPTSSSQPVPMALNPRVESNLTVPGSLIVADENTPHGPILKAAGGSALIPNVSMVTKNVLVGVFKSVTFIFPSVEEISLVFDCRWNFVENLATSFPSSFLNLRVRVPSSTPSSYLNFPEDSDPKSSFLSISPPDF